MTCGCDKQHNKEARTQVFVEATVVGAALIPMWLAVSQATAATRFGGQWKSLADIFISGFLFHVLAEESGVNDWYLTNSAAAHKVLGTFRGNDAGVPVRVSVDVVRTACARTVF